LPKTLSMVGRFIAFLLIILIPLKLISNAYFTHYHFNKDGHITSHAHPFKKGDNNKFPDHTHDDEELFFLELIHNSMPLVVADLDVKTPEPYFYNQPDVLDHTFIYKKLKERSKHKRGPPTPDAF